MIVQGSGLASMLCDPLVCFCDEEEWVLVPISVGALGYHL